MPTETGRIVKRKRVKLPDGSTVDIPVITQITFLDVVDRGQESQFHIENSGAAHRDVRVATVPGDGAATDENGGDESGLKVERIDIWRVLDVVDRGQESFIHLDNKTIKEPPDAPPYFITHEKTHIVKYINTPDDGSWIKSELIDKLKVHDTVDRGQETEFFLFNPPDNQDIKGLTIDTGSDPPTVAVDSDLDDISDSDNGVDPPWRTDPFQNIVDFARKIPIQPPTATVFIQAFVASEFGIFQDYVGSALLPDPPINIVSELPAGFLGTFYTFLSASATCHAHLPPGAPPSIVMGGLPGTPDPGNPNNTTLEILRLFNPQNDGIWPTGNTSIYGSSVSGLTIDVLLNYQQVITAAIQQWQINHPVGPPDRFTGCVGPADLTAGTAINCGAFTFSCDGSFWGFNGTLTFHTYAVKETRTDRDVSWTAYLQSQLGHPPGIP